MPVPNGVQSAMSDVYSLDRIDVPDVPPDYEDDTRDQHYVPAPCQVACPIGTDAPSYIAYIWEEKYPEAFEAITATNPFSSICGRVCDAPCEPACRRAQADGPILIRNLKRFVMDKVGHRYDPPPFAVTREESVAIVGAGPAGLTAAHELSQAGFKVEVHEMSDRPGGMMVWGIPAFRLPPGIIQEDIDRLTKRCPGLTIRYNSALGRDVSLAALKERHDAVLLTIGAWWGKPMGIPGEEDPRVVDGVGWLREINGGARPEMPETVVVVGGGDVAMDACRAALRLPGCKTVKVVYRRGPEEIPARKIELEGAIEEGIEFVYNTLQTAVVPAGNGIALKCLRTEAGEPDPEDGRRRPVAVEGSEHLIECGLVIAAVGQTAICEELEGLGMMRPDRVAAEFDSMRTTDPEVFAAGDGAFGGSTIVMAMHHGQRAAYYVQAFLDGREDPVPYRTPYRTRRVPVAQDLMWERFPQQHPPFHGVGETPVEFPEIESTYDDETAKAEAARCYRCDAETGSADYAVHHREDIFSMARTNPIDQRKNRAMLERRLEQRPDPFPAGRPATFDDLVFLPANLSRLVIDPYREACRVDVALGGRLDLERPFFVTGFDAEAAEVRAAVAAGLAESACGYIGRRPIGAGVEWLQLVTPDGEAPSAEAAALLYPLGPEGALPSAQRMSSDQLLGYVVVDPEQLAAAVPAALEAGHDMLLLDGSGDIAGRWPELAGPPDLTLLREAIATLRRLGREEEIDLIWFGGARSGTDAAKAIAMGCVAVAYGVPAGMAAGGEMVEGPDGVSLAFSSSFSDEDRRHAIVNLLKAHAGEASMMARCTGKTNLQNLEPEDMRAITLASAEATGIVLTGRH